MAAGGENRWPYLGRNRWPLTAVAIARLAKQRSAVDGIREEILHKGGSDLVASAFGR